MTNRQKVFLCLKAVSKSSLLLRWAWAAALGGKGADGVKP